MTCNHTPCPDGYIQWHEWAEQMSRTHEQKQCPTCGLYAIWEPRTAIMKIFKMDEIFDAYEHAKAGGQALHLHTLNQGHPLFRRYPVIAHLLDQDVDRLQQTAKRLGVRVIKVEHPGTHRQHIDLCGKPLERARAMAESEVTA